MTIKVACKCGQSFTAKDELQGQTMLCPKCHQPLTIGAPAVAAAKPSGSGLDELFDEVGLKEVKGPRCPSCGAAMLENAVICVHCGLNTQTGASVAAQTAAGKKSTNMTERILERAAETIETEKIEEKKVRSQGAPAWVLFAALIIVVGFSASMYLLPRDQAFQITGVAFIVLGGFIQIVCGIWLIVIAFKEEIVCGLLYLFVPFYSLYYWITRWSKCKSLVLKLFGGAAFQALGFGFLALAPNFAGGSSDQTVWSPNREARPAAVAELNFKGASLDSKPPCPELVSTS